ncbi:secreted RxLR effector protein 161-like [Lathyrus oleraceus]|uniref:secreted RxLR effector protein 161-like n=1 Tax=Pisum sativum TaxID=3888 RepID=UPI0021D0B5A7|nr:secreted RxLR effector protein 161-like [Pisum sativum]
MTDLGNIVYFLGMDIMYSEKGIILHQLKYELELNCKVDVIPANAIQKLNSDLDVGMVSMFMSKPKWSRYQAAVRILRYIKGTLKYGVWFPSGAETDSELLSYSDSDWYGDRVNRRSTYGYLFKFLGSPISWCSKKQPVVSLSNNEAEYITGVVATCEAVWLLNLLQDLKIKVQTGVLEVVHCSIQK